MAQTSVGNDKVRLRGVGLAAKLGGSLSPGRIAQAFFRGIILGFRVEGESLYSPKIL